jgi:hypothetical protein
MAAIPGSIPYTGFIAPTDSTDTFPVTKPEWGLGGLRRVADLTERDAITSPRRELGMLVYVVADQTYYTLKTGLTNSDWEVSPFTYQHLTPHTYAELQTLVSTNDLVQGAHYLLTDYQTIYDQPDFDNSGILKGTLVLKTETTEPLILTAASDSTFHATVISTIYPKDRIQYDFTIDETYVSNSPCKGRIIERIDDNNNRTDYDHRTVKFIRYESTTGSGVYNQYKDNAEDAQEFLTFGNNYGTADIRDNYMGDFWFYRDTHGYDLPNNVFYTIEFIQDNKFNGQTTNKTFADKLQHNIFIDGRKDYANIFNYATGQAPTLADFAAQIGFTLINGAKFGDTIVFDNVGYSVVDNAFLGVGLTGFLKCSAQTVGNLTFRNNTIKDIYFPLVETIGDRTFFSNEINRIYFPLVQTVGERCFAENEIEYFNAPIIQNIGPTTGLNDVFTNNTGNNVTVIAPAIHQTSNGGGLEGDLDYLDDNNTVTFDWDGQEVPDWAIGTQETYDFTSATHVYADYYCEIFRASNTQVYLKYFDGTQYQFVSPTS